MRIKSLKRSNCRDCEVLLEGVEQFLTQMKQSRCSKRISRRGETSEPLGYVPGASASTSAASASTYTDSYTPTVPAPPIPTEASHDNQRKMPHCLQAETAPHVSVRCGVKFALVLSGLTLQILSNGHPET